MAFFRLRDGDLAFREHGEGHGEAVILIHGFPMTNEIWGKTLELLSPRRRYVLPDLRGFGESAAPLAKNNTLTQLARDILALLDHIEIERSHLVGASLGGMVAMKLASLHPSRLHSLTVFNTVAHAESSAGIERREHQLETLRRRGVSEFSADFAAGLFPDGTPASDVEFLARNMAKASMESVIAGLELLRDREDQTDYLTSIAVPTLMVAGECDGGSSPQIMREMAQLCPHGEFRAIAGSGHMPSIQMPSVAAELLEDWLVQHEGKDAA